MMIIAVVFAVPAAADDTNPSYAPDRIFVKYSADVFATKFVSDERAEYVESILSAYTLVPGLQLVQLTEGVTVEEAIEYFEMQPGVEYAEPDYYLSISVVPDDPYYSELWGLKGVSSSGGVSAEYAWNVSTGSSDVIVAVLDTGVDYNHPDLEDNIWTNDDPVNGVDDDHNGYVDDLHGWNFVYDINDTMDYNHHGTHCAGIIGAVGNNGVGVAGTVWDVQIMPVSVLNHKGSGSDSSIIKGIEYAVANGADIISMSLGGNPGQSMGSGIRDVINAAGDKGVLFVIAAGNDNNNNDNSPVYPASYDCDNIISVAASKPDNNKADFSNYGVATVDIAAPGYRIYSTIPTVTSDEMSLIADSGNESYFGVLGDGWEFNSNYAEIDRAKESLIYLNSAVTLESVLSDLYISTMCRISGDNFISLIISNKSFSEYDSLDDINHDDIKIVFIYYRDESDWDSISKSIYNSEYISKFGTNELYLGLLYYSTSDSDYVRLKDAGIVTNYQISGHDYDIISGTSMATPMVAGAAALLKSVNPSLTYSEIKDVLMSTVDHVGDFNSLGLVGSRGRLNLSAAVESVIPCPDIDIISLKSGWNFMSVPKTLNKSNNTAEKVFGGINTDNNSVLVYNASVQDWDKLDNESLVSPLIGYWVYSITDDVIELDFTNDSARPLESRNVYRGWNAVGLCADRQLSAKYTFSEIDWRTVVEWNLDSGGFNSKIDNTDSYYTGMLTPGDGMWLFVNEDGVYGRNTSR